MPAPPPPPPPMGGPKAPKLGGGAPDDRGALLSSIRQGAKLKKTVTVDKSGPYIAGKENTVSSAPSGGSNGTGSARAPQATMNGGPPGLGGLFAGGMPKLRATGMGIGGSPRAESSAPKTTGNAAPKLPVNSTPKFPVNSAPTPSNVSLPRKSTQSPEKSKGPSVLQQPKSKSPSPQMEQTRVPSGPSVSQLSQVLGNTLMRGNEPPRPPEPRGARGPPPQPPAPNRLNLTTTSETTISTVIMNRVHNLSTVESTSQTILATPPSPNISSLHPNKSSLHGASTNWNSSNPLPSPTLTRTSSPNDVSDSSSISSRVINHGKPNVAPKPPGIVVSPNGQINNGKPQVQSPKKQPGLNGRHASRSQSVRVPRSPPVTPPCPPSSTEFSNNGFSPLKINAFHQSQDSIDRKPLVGLSKNAAPQPPLSGSRTLGRAPVRPPAHCPPPPPPSRPLNQPPPPPPHRQPAILPQHIRSNSSPNAGPPQPPVRNSSMRASELDTRFADKFRTMERFPFPDPFLKIEKTYSSVNSAINNNIVNKQQAPMPPKTHIQLTPKPWANNTSNC